ncbi:MAG TPA: SIMPL domain-containing protein [Mucilaginibacter sp.]|nr:SIMPL domain-containing protein [Mucilaginibacter sp.]
MKKLLIVAVISLMSFTTFAQNVDLRRKITVTGIAEQEVTPDIINVSISLQEYMDGKKRITIDQLENQLEAAVKQAGIAKEDFTVNNVSAWNNTWQKKKATDFLSSKQYTLRLHNLNKFDPILSSVDPKGIQSTFISSYDYSKMTELKRELKIQALLAAKEKATYLLNSINEKLGRAIDISESDNSNYAMANQVYSARAMYKTADAAAPESDIDFKKIKLSFQVSAVFEIAP